MVFIINQNEVKPFDYDLLLSNMTVMNSIFPYTVTSILVDSNIIIADLRYMSKNHGKSTTLLKLAKSQRINLFFPEQGLIEVKTYFGKIAKETKMTESFVNDLWMETFALYIKVYPEVKYKNNQLEEVLEQRDPKDIQFLRVMTALRPIWFLSEDKDISTLNITPSNYREVLIDLREYHAGETVKSQFVLGGFVIGLTGWTTIVSFFQLLRLILVYLNKLPLWIKGVLFVLVIISLSHPNSRERMLRYINTVTTFLSGHKEDILEIILILTKKWESANDIQAAAKEALELKHVNTNIEAKTAFDYIQLVLSQSHESLKCSQIAERVKYMGYKTSNDTFVSYIRKILRSQNSFTEDSNGTWSLGRSILN